MDRITFEIDNETKRKIKSRLGESGHTIKQVFGDFCTQYAEFGLLPGRYISIDNRRKLPEIAAVYFIIGDNENVLYIGATKQLKARIANHHRLSEFKEKNAKVFWIEANQDLAFELESELTELLEPELDQANNGRPTKFDVPLDCLVRARVPDDLAEWVRSQGNQADVLRRLIEQAMDAEQKEKEKENE